MLNVPFEYSFKPNIALCHSMSPLLQWLVVMEILILKFSQSVIKSLFVNSTIGNYRLWLGFSISHADIIFQVYIFDNIFQSLIIKVLYCSV